MKLVRLAFVAMVAGGPALAQESPSFNCAKATTPVERTICARPELAKADREIAAAYAALNAKIDGSAKDHALKDQTRWLLNRNKICAGNEEEIARCLGERYQARTGNLAMLAEDTYPFVSTQSRFSTGRVGRIGYKFDASWPQFDDKAVDFAELNRSFVVIADKAAQEVIPTRQTPGAGDRDQVWFYSQDFTLQRPSVDSVAVAVIASSYTGGAHGYRGTTAYLVDLRKGGIAEPRDVFVKGDGWLDLLTPLVRADLLKQFVEKPGFEDLIEPKRLAKMLRDPSLYYFRRDALELIFNPYVVGPYVSGPFSVLVPYATLKPLLSAEGPLASLR